MPLVDPATELPIERLRAIRAEAITELEELDELLVDSPHASPERSARGMSARTLVRDAMVWARQAQAPEARGPLIAEINLLYDVGVVGAEYYKLFVRDPTPKRPAGRI